MTVTIEPAVAQGTPFGLAELDLIGTFAGARFPFPLQVPCYGRNKPERDEMLAAAGETLAARGLATGYGPMGIAAHLVTALREHRRAMDVVVADGTRVTAIAAMVYGIHAVVCRQTLSERPGPVTVARIKANALADELIAQIPDADGAHCMPIALPPGVVEEALRLTARTGASAPRRRLVRLVQEGGGDDGAVDALAAVLPSVSGRGQLGVIRRLRDGGVDRACEVSWLDGPHGRVRVDRDTRGWVSVNPVRRSEFITTVREAATTARR